MPILTVEQAEYIYQTKYQAVYALRGVDCSFEAGQMTAIVGSSGSGKTTLLSLLAGLDVPTNGCIRFQGQSTAEMDRDAWRLTNVSVIYQNFNLFGHLTVLENAAYPLYLQKRPRKEAEDEAAAQLIAVGLKPEQFGRFPRMLSGGEQQRAAIARALTSGSALILADEPTGNLDEENSLNIFSILYTLAHNRGRCVIAATHDMALAEKTDCILHIQSGKIV